MSSPGACAPWAQQPVWALQPLAGFLPAPFPSLSKLTRWTQACPHHVPYCPGVQGSTLAELVEPLGLRTARGGFSRF